MKMNDHQYQSLHILLDNKKHENKFTRWKIVRKVRYLVAELYHKIINGKGESEKLSRISLDMSRYKRFFHKFISNCAK